MTRSPLLLSAAALATVALAAAGAGPAHAGAKDVRAAKRVLGNTVWTTYQSGDVTGASQDRSAHLCRDGSFVILSSFTAPIIDDSSYDHPYGESRLTGRWKVLRARLSADRRYGRVVVRYVTETGDSGEAVFTANARGTYVGGSPAEVGRSTVCP